MDFSTPHIMGILNLTPDSFSDGGKFNAPEVAEARILELMEQGADIIDIGGESTGPGAPDVTEADEMKRVQTIIQLIHDKKLTERVLFSIDTYKASVAAYALEHGFQMVNDVTALRGDAKMINVLLKYKPYVVLMYSKDPTARTTRDEIEYVDVVETIKNFWQERINILLAAGFPKEKIILDPGMGTFVSGLPQYSFEIIERLVELKTLGYPLLIGISRKSCLGGKLEERDLASIEWSLKAIQNGASLVRVHNVGMMKTKISITT